MAITTSMIGKLNGKQIPKEMIFSKKELLKRQKEVGKLSKQS